MEDGDPRDDAEAPRRAGTRPAGAPDASTEALRSARAGTLLVTAGVMVRDGRVLVARRPAHKAEGLRWEFPGGKVEPGEDEASCLARELREELGVPVRVGAFVAEGRSRAGGRPLCLRAYRVELLEGEPRPLEHAALRWVWPRELAGLDMPEADGPIVAALQAAFASGAGL